MRKFLRRLKKKAVPVKLQRVQPGMLPVSWQQITIGQVEQILSLNHPIEPDPETATPEEKAQHLLDVIDRDILVYCILTGDNVAKVEEMPQDEFYERMAGISWLWKFDGPETAAPLVEVVGKTYTLSAALHTMTMKQLKALKEQQEKQQAPSLSQFTSLMYQGNETTEERAALFRDGAPASIALPLVRHFLLMGANPDYARALLLPIEEELRTKANELLNEKI